METKTSLREAAAKALRVKQEQEAAEAERKAEVERQQFYYRNLARQNTLRAVFDIDVALDQDRDDFEYDGLKFRWTTYDRTVQIEGECNVCGKRTWSADVENLADLGEMLTLFVPNGDHWYECDHSGYDEDGEPIDETPNPKREPESPSDADQLRNLLRRFLGLDDDETPA